MPTWEERFAKREIPAPAISLIETCWRMTAPSGRVLGCAICRVETGIEVHCGYDRDLLRSQLVRDIDSAPDMAEQWRQAVIAKGGFAEIASGSSTSELSD